MTRKLNTNQKIEKKTRTVKDLEKVNKLEQDELRKLAGAGSFEKTMGKVLTYAGSGFPF